MTHWLNTMDPGFACLLGWVVGMATAYLGIVGAALGQRRQERER